MLHLRSVSKIVVLLFGLILVNSCKDIPRDNILDPKNPNSYRALIISLEAFVNTENDYLYNEYMLEALQTILARYPEKLVVMQYHRNTTNFTDSLALTENEILYEQYIEKFDNLKGVPDVFINGTTERIKGASSIASAIERIENAIQPLLVANSYLTIEPTVIRNNTHVSISTKIARLGSQSIEDILVKATVTEEIEPDLNSRVVRSIENSNLIPRLEPGEQKEIKFSEFTVSSDNDFYIIFTVTSNQNMIVNQSIEVAIR